MSKSGIGSEKKELLDQLRILLDSFFYNIKRSMQHSKNSLPLAEGQVFLLFLLGKHEKYKVSDIAGHLGVTAGAITAMTDKLVNEGLIARERSEEDRRVVWISLTEQGQKAIEEVQNSRYQFFRDRFQNLPEEDLVKTIEVFTKLNFHLYQERE